MGRLVGVHPCDVEHMSAALPGSSGSKSSSGGGETSSAGGPACSSARGDTSSALVQVADASLPPAKGHPLLPPALSPHSTSARNDKAEPAALPSAGGVPCSGKDVARADDPETGGLVGEPGPGGGEVYLAMEVCSARRVKVRSSYLLHLIVRCSWYVGGTLGARCLKGDRGGRTQAAGVRLEVVAHR